MAKAKKDEGSAPNEGIGMLKIPAPKYEMAILTIGQGPDQEPVIVNNVANKKPGFRDVNDAPPAPNSGKRRKPGELITRDVKKEYEDSLYPMPGKPNEYGLKVMGFKKGMATMAKDIEGVNATMIKRMIQIAADEPGGELVRIRGSKPKMCQHVVRVESGMKKVPVDRFRAMFEGWETDLKITYNADFLSFQDVVNLCANTGIFIGWGELRPEQGGNNGKWVIKKASHVVPKGA